MGGDFLATLVLLGLAIGLSVSPATDTIMSAFPESELGVGGPTNDTAMELGGSLGIAILGSVLAGTYKGGLADTAGGKLPAAMLETAKDSIGGAQSAAQQITADPAGGVSQAQALLKAANSAFAEAVSHTSLIGGIILAVGTTAVALLLPNRRSSTDDPPTTAVEGAKAADGSVRVPVGD